MQYLRLIFLLVRLIVSLIWFLTRLSLSYLENFWGSMVVAFSFFTLAGILAMGIINRSTNFPTLPRQALVFPDSIIISQNQLVIFRDKYLLVLNDQPHNPEVLINLGLLEKYLGQEEKSQEYLDKARELFPNHWLFNEL